ncbi:MAG TPA: alanine acetyltransferase [Pseudoxanthomonas sp.]|nr:alanine acetyltransferase [Pseudoxanthomonas sp.]
MSTVAPQALWSAQQQVWLSALGHTLYLQGALPETVADAAAPAPASASASGPASAMRQSSPAQGPRSASPAASTARQVAPRRGGSRLPDRLHFALIRASGCDPNAPGAPELFASWPSSSELRGNPAAKRALWPRLRALRKSVQT